MDVTKPAAARGVRLAALDGVKAPSEKTRLAKYRSKRQFDETPEPTGSKRLGKAPRGAQRFVVQKHHASHLHYDFRLEAGGVLKSWAVPKGPTLRPDERRLAMQVEDHPLDYFDFEGSIPAGNYGAGEVIVWDWGTYEPIDTDDADSAIAKGKLSFRMHGEKLLGVFTLVKMHGRTKNDNAWLLLKSADEAADSKWDAGVHDASVKSGHTLTDVKVDPKAKRWRSSRAAAPDDSKHAPMKATRNARTATSRPPKTQKRDPLPRVAQPELATLVDAPFDDPDWLYEIKWDGFRALTTIHEDGRVEIVSRNGKDFLSRFPSLASLANSFRNLPIMLDGEIVAVDEDGKSSFQVLQNHTGAKTDDLKYVVFDVLYAHGRDLRGEPLEKRKEILAALVRPKAGPVMYSAHTLGKGTELFEAARAQGLEGIIAKRRQSPYVEKRTRDWLKIKAQLEQECVIAGFTAPTGSREGFGSLILGLYERGHLVHCGNVGTGFDERTIRSLMKKLRPLVTKESPFDDAPPKTRTTARWVAPKLVAQVRFTEWTDDGSMRHAVFLGLRDDKSPRQAHRERPRATKRVA